MPFADAGRRSSDRLLGDFVLGKCSTLPRQHGRDLSNDSTLAQARGGRYRGGLRDRAMATVFRRIKRLGRREGSEPPNGDADLGRLSDGPQEGAN
jgi:hypothetical protein